MATLRKTKIFICGHDPNRDQSRHLHVQVQETAPDDISRSLSLSPWSTAKDFAETSITQIDVPTPELFNSLEYEPSNPVSYQQHCYLLNNNQNQHQKRYHSDLIRTDSGNSSLNTIDSISNHSSRSLTGSSNDGCCPYYGSEINQHDDFLLINVFVPETQSEFDITCSYRQSIWYVKTVLIEQLCGDHHQQHSRLLHDDQTLNYGLFSNHFGYFLDEQLTFYEYFWNNNSNDCNSPLLFNHHNYYQHDNQINKKNKIVKLEFLYKQRIKYGEIMSTLPLASATRKKRKRSRLLNAIQNCNLDKLAKALVNCDPNFVDEATGETPLSLAAAAGCGQTSSSSSSSNSTTLQQIIAAIVNGGALLDFRTKDGRTALHVAVQKSNFVALKTLLDLGASPNYLDSNGLTPLYYSVIYKANPKLTQLLLYEHATHGITDQHGWQEIHHASKLGLVQHLEQLLFYGCDMNCRIAGSGNTSLHVAAINDQVECARILLLRGCDTSIVNNSHQNAYQVAVIAANMSLAEFIKNHKSENVVPYRDKPRYNPARRPANSYSENSTPNKTHAAKLLTADINGSLHQTKMRSISPSLSQLTNNTTTTSSGVCCEDEDDSNRLKQQCSVMNNGNSNAQQQLNEPNYDDDGGDDDQNGNMVLSSESEDSGTFSPGMMVKAISDYNSGDPSHMQLRRNDHVLLLHSDHSPPTIASQKLLLGRRCLDGQEGFFPACCVEKIKPIKDTESGDRVEGRRDMKMKNMQAATLPTRGRRGARKSYLDKSTIRQYQDRTVTLHRGSKGFGFVLRGAKDSSPILTKQLMQQQGSVPLIGLQYFDEIEIGGVADAAGLKRGDFLLAVNDVDVRHMSHENVVQLIRKSGDKVTMTIATPVPKQLVSILKKKGTSQTNNVAQNNKQSPTISDSKQSNNGAILPPPSVIETMPSSQNQMQMSQSVYASFTNSSSRTPKAPPPAPPKRDPSTTLSNTSSRTRARSLVVASEVRSAHNQALMLLNEVKTAVDDDNSNNKQEETKKRSSPPNLESTESSNNQSNNNNNATRSCSSRRISSYEPSEFNNENDNSRDSNKSQAMVEMNNNNNVDAMANHDKPVISSSELQKKDSCTMSPPTSPPHHSIINVTLSKVQNKNEDNKTNESNNAQSARRSLLSFQPTTTTNKIKEQQDNESISRPRIPEPDYSSDEDDQKNNKENVDKEAVNDSTMKKSEKVKLTTKATVVLKSTSPCPPESSDSDLQLNTERKPSESLKNGMIGSKNIFEELKEQSAKITSAARLRFENNNSSSMNLPTSISTEAGGAISTSTKAPNNVKKNVAEFEKRLNGANISKDQIDTQQLRMSKSCMEEFVTQQAMMSTLKKDIVTSKPNLRQKPSDQTTDFRRNSAIISAMAEKVAAVNQLVAEQQQQSGSKSLNSSPIPTSLEKVPGQVASGSTVVVQKPIAILPGGSVASSGTLTRRCVTVCEDPVKTIHLQQQQQQLRSHLATTSMGLSGTGTLTKSQKPYSSSLAESTTASILKQSSKSSAQQQMRNVNQPAYHSTTPTNVTSSIDVVPPPPEFAAVSTQQAIAGRQTAIQQQQQAMNQQKIYLQRQLQSATSPLTIQQPASSNTQVHTHHQHQHSQLISGDQMPHPQHYSHQTTHYHLHHNHPSTTASTVMSHQLSSSAPTNTDGHSMMAMRQSILAQQQQPLTSSTTNYDYLVQQQQRTTNPLVSHHHHHQLPQSSTYVQQSTSSQQQQQQNQLLFQQRALAAANAKLYQQQQLSRSGGGQYNTLASSKPQQIQYYITQQQHQSHQNSTTNQQQQYFATLSRHQHAQVQQQYLNSLTSQQQQMQQQQFATLTRHHQQQLLQHQPSSAAVQQQQNLVSYSQLIQQQQQQQRQQQQFGTSNVANPASRSVQMQSSSTLTRQTPMSNAQTTTKMVNPYSAQQQYQYQTQQLAATASNVAYARKSVVEWTTDDVREWLQRIGMAEHRMKFESFNGAKMLRLDNNSLANIGVRQQQHRIYILEKLKQQIWQNHQ